MKSYYHVLILLSFITYSCSNDIRIQNSTDDSHLYSMKSSVIWASNELRSTKGRTLFFAYRDTIPYLECNITNTPCSAESSSNWDMANKVNGDNWRMPTKKEWEELLTNYSTWCSPRKNPKTVSVYSSSDRPVLFLNHVYWLKTDEAEDVCGVVITARDTTCDDGLYHCTLTSSFYSYDELKGQMGMVYPVKERERPLVIINSSIGLLEPGISKMLDITTYPKVNKMLYSTNNPSVAKVDAKGRITGLRPGKAGISIKSNGVVVSTFDVRVVPKTVDLGLSVLWAECNLGARTPQESGDYFSYGEVEPKNWYDEHTYKNQRLDAAYYRHGVFRMPTESEVRELATNCTIVYSKVSRGWWLTSKINGRKLFLPEAGYIDSNKQYSGSYYWITTKKDLIEDNAMYIGYDIELGGLFEANQYPSYIRLAYTSKYDGCPIRPVRNKIEPSLESFKIAQEVIH